MFDISRELYAKCWNFLVRLVFSLRCALVSRSNHTGSFREYATEGVFTWENSHRRGFHTGMTFWFRIAFTWWRGYFISRLFERTVHLYKIQVRCKIANITHTLPVLVHLLWLPKCSKIRWKLFSFDKNIFAFDKNYFHSKKIYFHSIKIFLCDENIFSFDKIYISIR